MATVIKTIQVDDFTGEEADELFTYSFDVNGKTYSIDLTEANADVLINIVHQYETAIAPYVEKATVKGSKRKGRKTGTKSTASGRDDLAEIRAWAAKAGHDVAAKGRVPVAVIQAYDAAH